MSGQPPKHDIFVSYAHVDDDPLPGITQGWVSRLVYDLKIYLNQKLGRREGYSLWMDGQLRGNTPLTPEILEHLQNSEILLLILSPGYVASTWCLKELENFLQQHAVESGRIFVVEREKLGETERPPALRDLAGYEFWVRDRDEQIRTLALPSTQDYLPEYYRRVEDMVRQMVERICLCRKQPQPQPAQLTEKNAAGPAAPADSVEEPAVYLAPVPDSLQVQRAEMMRFLDQQGIKAMPQSNRISLASYREDMEAALRGCSHFVQLLDASSNNGIPIDQHVIASLAKIPLLQWRSRELDMSSVNDPEHRELLEGSTVMASTLVEFQQHILTRLRPAPEAPESEHTGQGKMVFINTGQEDFTLAEEISRYLSEKGYFCLLPLTPTNATRPADIRKDLEQNMLDCDVLLLLYARSPVTQVREFLKHCFRIRSRRERPLPAALCMSHEGERVNLNAALPNLRLLECSTPFPAECVDKFLREASL